MVDVFHHTGGGDCSEHGQIKSVKSESKSLPARLFIDFITYLREIRKNLHGRFRWVVLLAVDLDLLFLSPFAALILRDNYYLSWQKVPNLLPYSKISFAVGFICFLIAGTHRSIWRHVSLRDFTRIIVTATLIVVLSSFLEFALYKFEGIPRSLPLLQLFFLIASMSVVRLIVRWWYKGNNTTRVDNDSNAPEHKENVLLVGLNHVAELYLRCVNDLASGRISVIGILDENPDLKGRFLFQSKVLGEPAELPQILAKFNVHGVEIRHVVITERFDKLSQETRETLLTWERSGRVELDRFEERLGFGRPPENRVSDADAKEVSAQSGAAESKTAANSIYPYVKRGMDFIAALALILLLSPLFALVSILVAIDVGYPLIFWQQRPGRQGKPINLYKFRTMKAGHDKSGKRIADEHRTSATGLFLRRFRLDELPQLFNILIGDLSFVGPRPLLPVDQPEGFHDRLSVMPGLSGWAQVNGGKQMGMEDKMLLDIWYINHLSFWLDAKIIFRTIKVLIQGDQLDETAIKAAGDEFGAGERAEAPVPLPVAPRDKDDNELQPVRQNMV